MEERNSDYALSRPSGWLPRKLQGLVNRYYWMRHNLQWSLHVALRGVAALDHEKMAPGSTPILINNFNRLETLRVQLEWLLSLEGSISIVILDNASTYPPLLDFYRSLDHPRVQVLKLGYNSCGKGIDLIAGKLAGFRSFIVTDPDVLPYPTTPRDVVPHLVELLDRHREFNHVGLSLEIDDLPDHAPLRERVRAHESQFWPPKACKLNDDLYIAGVDTTFAIYRNSSNVLAYEPALRTARPYTLKHVDWYRDPASFSDEYLYYLRSCRAYATWTADLRRAIGHSP